MTPTSSPFAPTSYPSSTAQRPANGDLLLHRVLDKNYRLQATPHTHRKEKKPPVKSSWRDTTSPLSSPPTAAPQLRSEIFSSPIRAPQIPADAPRTPGISVNVPARLKARKEEISWESDSDQDADEIYKELGMSPPKTIQFAVAPSRLLQTPGKLIPSYCVWALMLTTLSTRGKQTYCGGSADDSWCGTRRIGC